MPVGQKLYEYQNCKHCVRGESDTSIMKFADDNTVIVQRWGKTGGQVENNLSLIADKIKACTSVISPGLAASRSF